MTDQNPFAFPFAQPTTTAPQQTAPQQAQPPAPQAPAAPAPPVDITQHLQQQTAAAAGPIVPPRQTGYHANTERVDIGDDNVKTGEFDVYKGSNNRIDRIALLTPRDIAYGRVHYIEGNEKDRDKPSGYLICDSKFQRQGKNEIVQQNAICCEKLGVPRKRFAALVIHYTTAPNGTLLQPFSFVLKVWRFNETIFETLRTINRELPLETHDLIISCKDEQYQKLTINAAANSVLTVPEFRQQFGAEVAGFVAMMQPRLERLTGRKLEPQEWAQVLGAGGYPGVMPGVAGVPGVSDAPIPDLAALLSAPVQK